MRSKPIPAHPFPSVCPAASHSPSLSTLLHPLHGPVCGFTLPLPSHTTASPPRSGLRLQTPSPFPHYCIPTPVRSAASHSLSLSTLLRPQPGPVCGLTFPTPFCTIAHTHKNNQLYQKGCSCVHQANLLNQLNQFSVTKITVRLKKKS